MLLANLKTALAARHMRQVDLAMSLRITPSALSEIINGRREANPALRGRIAEALHADEGWLFSCFARIPGPTGCPASEETVRDVVSLPRGTSTTLK
jgi:transcriptional regulator with XRE-family HTH domain